MNNQLKTFIKKIMPSLPGCILLLSISANAAEVGQDKYKHAAGCALISSATAATLQTVFPEMSKIKTVSVSIATTMLVGIAKELTDDHVDMGDLAADGVGAVGGQFVFILKEW